MNTREDGARFRPDIGTMPCARLADPARVGRPPLDPRLLTELRRLCTRSVRNAEAWRRLGAAAERIGLSQPSYGWVRELAKVERQRIEAARARREFWADVAGDFAVGLVKRPGFRVLEHMERKDRDAPR